jgi:DnaJ-class molecular chaperone
MVNLKKRRHKAICSECNGNGYKQFQIQKDGKLNEDKTSREHIVLQCDTCDSEGEIYVDESEVVELYVDDDTSTSDVGKLH